MDYYAFYTGKEFDAYKYLGAHLEGKNCTFRTFASEAVGIELAIGDKLIPMNRIYDGNFYELKLKAKAGDTYEYRIHGKDGSVIDHMDPYGHMVELRPKHKSVIADIDKFNFTDQRWMKNRTDMKCEPLNIYEIHAGSWRKKKGKVDGFYSYIELAKLLIPYLKDHSYNYVEFMPLCEHPTDESWGYQNTGYFAPTSRYGNPDELKEAIDAFHNNGIGVILDFVPAHFALDAYALKKYDGTSLYEYPSDDVGVSEWGSCNFMHSRPEVRSFLQSSVNYWINEYHFDGIRMDAVSRLIYWQGDEKRGENGSAIDFIKCLNKGIKERHPQVMLIAEDSTNYPKVTELVDKGGLGFDYKWDLGWMHDTLEYFQSPPSERMDKYHKLTFSMMYFKNEKYLLPFSHDEVVHGKATILEKMNGDYEVKFSQAKVLYMYMLAHPGKKLNFMGNEIGQFREWDEKREQDWDLLKYPAHDSFCKYMSQLNGIYLKYDAFWSMDYEDEGFQWLDCHSENKCLYAIIRKGKKDCVIAAFNLSEKTRSKYSIPVKRTKKSEVLLYTDWEEYGGKTAKGKERAACSHGQIVVDLAAFSGMLINII